MYSGNRIFDLDANASTVCSGSRSGKAAPLVELAALELFEHKMRDGFYRKDEIYPVKAPAPPPGYQSDVSLFTSNLGARSAKKPLRTLPQAPEKILDAPDMLDDYYLNLLDWGSGNSVSSFPTMPLQ